MKRKIIVSVINDLATDQRVRKVCEALHELDYEVLLVGRRLKSSLPMPQTLYNTKRMRLIFTKGPLFYAFFNFRLFWFLIFHRADALLANDLDTLLANTWARKFKANCKLYYDSHEYFTGVPELIARPKVQAIWKKIERKCIPKVDAMYTVNKSIAEMYQKEYHREIYVVRNISDFKGEIKRKSRAELGLPEDKFIAIMQGAGINVDRGAEEMVKAVEQLDDVVLLIVGDGDVVPQLKEEVRLKKLENKVIFKGKRPYLEMMEYTAASDLGVSLDKDSNVNYRFSLPNKIFDYIHAGIPLLVSDLVEVKRVVQENKVGIVLGEYSVESIVKTIAELKNDAEALQKYRENTYSVKHVLNWQHEKKVLTEIYG